MSVQESLSGLSDFGQDDIYCFANGYYNLSRAEAQSRMMRSCRSSR